MSKPQEATFRLPFPPSTNHYWRHRWQPVKGPRKGFIQTYISERGQQYRDDVQAAVLFVTKQAIRPVRSRLDVAIRLCPPDRAARDLDNYAKAMLDALTFCRVWADDKQIDRLTIERGPVLPGGHADVTIRVLPSSQTALFDSETVARATEEAKPF